MKENELPDKEKEPEIDQGMDTSGGDSAISSKNQSVEGITRRSLVTGVGGTVALCALGGVRFAGTTPLVRPPGGQDFERLTAACIRCEKCVEVCPRHVVKPAHIEHGILGMRTPTLNFDRDWCNWCEEENNGHPLCVEVCPTEALSLPEGAEQETTILGIAELDSSVCLAYLDLSCRFCYDACPFEAIHLDENHRPSIITEKCNGCGACEAVCVVFENASISADAKERAVMIRALDEDGKIVNGLPGGGMTS
ncbi:MAG: 4Fe-4S dicluster domain-containing protein [Coriobacteriales bacterium]|jgi:ferredoxin-type protein NapG|nr:4Fe-4S dicluster domain-containing protein [Coriobacteriales bacterium]